MYLFKRHYLFHSSFLLSSVDEEKETTIPSGLYESKKTEMLLYGNGDRKIYEEIKEGGRRDVLKILLLVSNDQVKLVVI